MLSEFFPFCGYSFLHSKRELPMPFSLIFPFDDHQSNLSCISASEQTYRRILDSENPFWKSNFRRNCWRSVFAPRRFGGQGKWLTTRWLCSSFGGSESCFSSCLRFPPGIFFESKAISSFAWTFFLRYSQRAFWPVYCWSCDQSAWESSHEWSEELSSWEFLYTSAWQFSSLGAQFAWLDCWLGKPGMLCWGA